MSTLEGGDVVEGFSIVSHDLDAPFIITRKDRE